MWKLQAKLALAVLFAMLVATLGVTIVRGYNVDWKTALTISVLAASIFSLRAYFPLRREHKRLIHTFAVFVDAANELARDMAKLSLADLSIFLSAERSLKKGEADLIFVTKRGSANHQILVQMTDLRVTFPYRMIPAESFAIVEYALTDVGVTALPKILGAVRSRRETAEEMPYVLS